MTKQVPVEVIYTDPRFDSELPEHENFTKLSYGKKGNAAMDLRACIEEPIVIKPGERLLIPAGFKMWLKEGLEASLMPRSGLGSKQGIVIGNLVGLIDPNYQGVAGICVWNSNQNTKWEEVEVTIEDTDETTTELIPFYNKEAEFTIYPGDRICQMKIAEFVEMVPEEVEVFSGDTERGEDGFGASGIK